MFFTLFAVNKNGTEICCNYTLYRNGSEWTTIEPGTYELYSVEEEGDPDICIVELPKGTIKKIFGTDMTWEDDYRIL